MFHALSADLPVLPVFIFDEEILEALPDNDARVEFIHQSLEKMDGELKNLGSALCVIKGEPLKVWKQLSEEYELDTVFYNHDMEPYPLERDKKVESFLNKKGIRFQGYKDHLIFEGAEVVKDDGKPYTVFTPYKKKWLTKLQEDKYKAFQKFPSEKYTENFYKGGSKHPLPQLSSMGFRSSGLKFPTMEVTSSIVQNYDKTRDFPAIQGTTRLGIHFRFGTISIREKAEKAMKLNETYLSELIWRDFYAMILHHFPNTVSHAFRPEYDKIRWNNSAEEFEKWKKGETGYALVDAGMRELKNTGYMHNRVRMVVASFLTKHLLIDWRWGEAWFAEKLLDFEQASNVGGWQWAAGCGTDAAPYFRIFNPEAQADKFDPKNEYIKKWVPEFGTSSYAKPIVDHKYARERCLARYKEALAK